MAVNYLSGNSPTVIDTQRVLEVKILNAINGGVSGGTGGPGIVGVGSPEGVVTAPVGTSYFDSSTNSFWYKRTGAGNTGWVELIA